MLDTKRKNGVRKNRDSSSSAEIKILTCNDLEVAAVPKKMTRTTGQSIKIAPKDTEERREDNAEPTELFAFDNSLCGKLPPGYTTPPRALNIISSSFVLKFCELG